MPKQLCPRCKRASGDSWQQCPKGGCPMEMSPHFDKLAGLRADYLLKGLGPVDISVRRELVCLNTSIAAKYSTIEHLEGEIKTYDDRIKEILESLKETNEGQDR